MFSRRVDIVEYDMEVSSQKIFNLFRDLRLYFNSLVSLGIFDIYIV